MCWTTNSKRDSLQVRCVQICPRTGCITFFLRFKKYLKLRRRFTKVFKGWFEAWKLLRSLEGQFSRWFNGKKVTTFFIVKGQFWKQDVMESDARFQTKNYSLLHISWVKSRKSCKPTLMFCCHGTLHSGRNWNAKNQPCISLCLNLTTCLHRAVKFEMTDNIKA